MLRVFSTAALLSVLPWPLAAQTAVPLVEAVPSITVEGTAKREVVPDLAILTLGVTSSRPTADQAATDVARAAQRVVTAARTAGVGDGDIQTADLRLAAVTDPHGGAITSFQASNRITLRLHDLAKIGALVGQMVAQGANTIDGIDFEAENPQPILDRLRTEASDDARAKAELYASASGVKLGRVLRITPDAASPAPVFHAFKMQAAAAPPVEAGRQTLESRVQITWELLP